MAEELKEDGLPINGFLTGAAAEFSEDAIEVHVKNGTELLTLIEFSRHLEELIEARTAVRPAVRLVGDEKIVAEEDVYKRQGQKDLDLVLRPSGEMRQSNFMLWQASYAEFIYMDVLWPDFTRADLDRAIDEFNHRSRRFGGL